ncbi:hypothetical protein GGR56DRAFT_693268 [Xylariaceae sp. FL0804]|nr:hypothetical protein GGR56DRAFT_693268 [Xylariaceae sp. FL0804]
MASKRPAESDVEPGTPKRRRDKASSRPKRTGLDPTYGQYGAFGDLQDGSTAPGDSDLECEDDSEALSYLRSVRAQATAIPHVVVAKKAGPALPPQSSHTRDSVRGKGSRDAPIDYSIYSNGVGDFRGYYQDGAYTAYPEGYWDESEDDQERDEDGEGEAALDYSDESHSSESPGGRPHNSSADEIRDAYFASLTKQYVALRRLLRADPPDSLLRALPPDSATTVDSRKRWWARIAHSDPLPVQVAGMRKDTVVRLLRLILRERFLRKARRLSERCSRWIWALLARLPDRGELNFEEVGHVRELGKRAVLLMVSLAELGALKAHGAIDSDDDDDNDDDDSEEDDLDADHEGVEERRPDGSAAEQIATPHNGIPPKAEPPSGESRALPDGANTEPPAPQIHQPAKSDGSSDVEMQMEDSDLEDGEVADVPPSPPRAPEPEESEESAADIETAKARLLAQLGRGEPSTTAAAAVVHGDAGDEVDGERDAAAEEEEEEERAAAHRARINERATLNMILTVAGEFYGQRDLLEFRDPFGGLQLDDDNSE